MPTNPITGPLRRGLVVFVVSVVMALGWTGFRAWGSWQSVERIAFDTGSARGNLEAMRVPTTTLPDAPPEAPPPPPPDPFDDVLALLVVGSDQRSAADLSRRADVILMFVVAPGADHPLLFSIPRDLYLPNPCTGGMSRVNANLNGCGDLATGPEQLAVAVEDFTGIGVDHFAVFDFEGFKAVIDRVGGVQICVDTPVRDLNSHLDLPAGCTTAKGEQALAWVRSRHTQELVDGRWRIMQGVNDLARNQRQQEMVLEALRRLRALRSISELSALVEDLSDAFSVDEGLSLTEAVSIAWNLRSIETDAVVRLVLPTRTLLTDRGELVLDPEEPFRDTLYASDPDLAAILLP